MVPQPVIADVFDSAESPHVVIEEWNPQTGAITRTLATYTTTSGVGSEVVRVDLSTPCYIVNWHTELFTLSTTLRYRIRVLVGNVQLGYADVDVVANGGGLRNVDTSQYVALVGGSTLPIKFRMNRCSPVVCQSLDACHVAGTCDPNTGVCSNPSAPDGSACNDGNACTRTDSCRGGVCVGGNPVVCIASDQCHDVGICDPTTGVCSNPNKSDGTGCNDGDACTQIDTCQSGHCEGDDPVVCTALDQCHVPGLCNPLDGACSNPIQLDGMACDDANACTRSDSCQQGVCTGSSPVICSALDQCHLAGSCDPASGICSNPSKPDGASCDDGDACTRTDTCNAGTCAGANPVVCPAPDQCHTAGSCDSATGLCSNPAKANGTPCNDGNACTRTDACQAGACIGTNLVICSALDQCHQTGICDPNTGVCSNPPQPDGTACDDGIACTQNDVCRAGVCAGAPCPMPDLQITAVTAVGQVGSCPPSGFDVTVTNFGNAATALDLPTIVGGSPYVSVPDNTPFSTEFITIQPGASYTVHAQATIPVPMTAPLTITFTADPNHLVAESNEDNNSWAQSVAVPPPADPLPNLVVTNVSFNHNPALPTDRILLSVDMQNTGQGTAYLCSGVTTWAATLPWGGGVGGVNFGSVQAIAPGGTFSGGVFIVEPGQRAPGSYSITATVDPNGDIAESNETDNSRTATLTITPPSGTPDLRITGVAPVGQVGPCPPPQFDVTVTNFGNGDAVVDKPKLVGGSPYISVVDTTPFSTEYITITAGTSYVIRVDANIPSPMTAPLSITFTADPTNVVAELDETNNQFVQTVPVPPPQATLPDLAVTSVTFSPNPATSTNRVSITVNMQNVGAGTAYFCSGATEWTAQLPWGGGVGGVNFGGILAIAPGGTFFGGVFILNPGQQPAGSYTVTATVDPGNSVVESNETNNSNTGTLTIQ